MTNREKYAKEILDIACTGSAVGLKDGKPFACNAMYCTECGVFGSNFGCVEKLKKWCESEYIEPSVDWSKVPVDTKIFVRNDENEIWFSRHFAKYVNGKVYSWANGRTSWSTSIDNICDWNYAKLADEE